MDIFLKPYLSLASDDNYLSKKLATVAFMAGTFWAGHRSKSHLILIGNSELDTPASETEIHHNNSKLPALSRTTIVHEQEEPPHPQS